MHDRLAKGGLALAMVVAASVPVAAGAQDGGYVPSTVAPASVASTLPSQVGNAGASSPNPTTATASGSSLPVTGDDSGRLALVGATLALAGAGLVVGARRRQSRASTGAAHR